MDRFRLPDDEGYDEHGELIEADEDDCDPLEDSDVHSLELDDA